MAAVVVAAGEAFLSVAFEAIFAKLSSLDVLNYARRNNIEPEVNRWKNLLGKMKSVLDDAEERQMSEKRIKIWLDELRDLAYDVEDILDEFSTEVMAETEASPSKVRKVITTWFSFLSPRNMKFNVSFGSKMKVFAQRFERLTKEKEDLKLTERTTRISGGAEKGKLETTSLPESHVYGRETDKKTLISKLLSGESNGEPFSVVAIVGMGGLGKTTLAQLLYNDDSVKTSFDIKAWVCVSDEFDVFKITVKILETFTKRPCNMKDLNNVQEKLRDALQGKKFLLILDDVWNKNYSQWDALSRPLAAGGLGSKVLITTRNEDVATTAGAVFMHRLNKLKPDECSSLLARHALGENDFSRHPTLQEMGEEIAKKCDGLPLAAKAIGGLLRGKSNPGEWSTVLKSNMWDLPQDECPIMPALKLSYHYLPSHLKRCFAYCAIFPKDYPFDKDDLVLWWMADGFLEQSTNFMEVGDRYFKDLLSRSFFQRLTNDEDSKFVMHDLMNDLAMWISDGICLHLPRGKESAFGMKFENLRHLSFMGHRYEMAKRFEKFSSSTGLRTFIAFKEYDYVYDYSISNVILDNVTVNLRCLKLLCLSGYQIQKLPDSISELKQLRHLDMSFTKIRLLSESISGLLNLQILKLTGCFELIQLPKEMRKLVNLRLLDISETPKLEWMPSGIGRLTNLQILPKFIIGENHGLRLKELKGLSFMRGELSISRLENVVDIQDARDANLKSKEGLVSLKFCWTEDTRDLENENDEQILAKLEPHTSLNSLAIVGYNGKHFPRWIGDCSFTKLETLTLHGCKSASSLPHLGGLISLKTLQIVGMHEVKKIGKEFWGNTLNSNHVFPSLETLILSEMNGLQEWCSDFGCGDEAEVVFPLLQTIVITDCPVLVGKLPNQLPSLAELSIRKCPLLEDLSIWHCSNLTNLPNQLPLLGELIIRDCPNLTILPNQLPLLQKLSIEGCLDLTNLPNQLPFLEELSIEGCSNLTNLECKHPSLRKLFVKGCSAAAVKTLGSLSSLESLELENIRELRCIDDGILSMLGALQELQIVSCPELKTLVRNGKGIEEMVGLKRLQISSCDELEALVGGGDQGLHCLPSLESLGISNVNKLVSFGPMRLPSSLKYMGISWCNALKCLPEGFMMDGSSPCESALETLYVCFCPSLTTFPGERFPRQLVSLTIRGCTNLEIMLKFSDSIKSLEIISCDRLQSLPTLPASLVKLLIEDLQNLTLRSIAIEKSMPISSEIENFQHRLPSLESIEIGNAEEIESAPKKMFDYCASSLEELTIRDLNWRRLPENITSFQKMKCLKIWKCENLRGLPKQMQEFTCLQELKIRQCPYLELLAGRDLPRELIDLEITSCEKVIEGLFDGGLSTLSSLTHLYIDGENCDVNIKQGSPAFLPKLQTLCISKLGNLESLATAFELSALLPSLEYLSIYDCPLLRKRFLDRKGECLSLLSSIPRVDIDGEELC